jgi:hypothetical protein
MNLLIRHEAKQRNEGERGRGGRSRDRETNSAMRNYERSRKNLELSDTTGTISHTSKQGLKLKIGHSLAGHTSPMATNMKANECDKF